MYTPKNVLLNLNRNSVFFTKNINSSSIVLHYRRRDNVKP